MSQSCQESFSVSFEGTAFDSHEMSAAALAQSLLAIDGLARKAAQSAYGRTAEIDIKVKGGFKQGSFLIDLIIQHKETVAFAGSAVTILVGVIQLCKWARGKKVTPANNTQNNGNVNVTNSNGEVNVFNVNVVNLYNQDRTASLVSRATQTLDFDGAEAISIKTENVEATSITKVERSFLRQEEGLVITDNERQVLLEVVSPMLNGSPQGWRFIESDEDMSAFQAQVEDEDFLNDVKEGKYNFVNGTSLLVTLRSVQRKTQRTRTERTVVEVQEIIQPEKKQ